MNESDHEEELLTIHETLKLADFRVDTLNYLRKAEYFKHIKSVEGVGLNRKYTYQTAEILKAMKMCLGRCADLREAYVMALQGIAFKKRTAGNARSVQLAFMDPRSIKTHPKFEDLAGRDDDLLVDLIADMTVYGFYPSQPLALATWPGQPEPVLGHGGLRLKAAIAAGIKLVPVVILVFADEQEVLEFIAKSNTRRRKTDDWVLYQLITALDGFLQRGGDRRSEAAKSVPPMGGTETARALSAHRTAGLVGCGARTVDRARRISKHDSSEILEALESRKMTIRQAEKVIAERAHGRWNTPPASPVSEALDDMVQLTPENLEGLKKLGGNRYEQANIAIREFLARKLQETEVSAQTDTEAADPTPGASSDRNAGGHPRL
ncbi:MAG: hypothetical protein V1792_04805 [Pseudomonadota bacterium]